MSKFNVAIIGIGLMGGSLAFALRGFRDCRITGYDIDPEVTAAALEKGAVDHAAPALFDAVRDADLTVFCSSPHTILENMRACVPVFKDGSVVTELCGVKRGILAFAAEHMPDGVDYVGLHPMAGKEVGGFQNADPAIFKGAGFLLVVPEKKCRPEPVALLKALSAHVGAGRVEVNRAGEHDRLIAYTSDLMHISATALCAAYPEGMTTAHTAGAFRDCTRIADIDAALWAELLTQNADNITPFLDAYIDALTGVRDALAGGGRAYVHSFLSRAAANKRKMKTL